MSRGAGYPSYGAVQEYKDNPYDNAGYSVDEEFSQITRNIESINKGANIIEQAAKVIGTDRDSGHAGDKIHRVSQDTSKTVSSTTKLFVLLSSKRLDRTQKLLLEKVKNNFQESVQRFQTLQKNVTDKVKNTRRVEKPKPTNAWLEDDNDDKPILPVEENSKRLQLLAQDQVIDDDLLLIREREDQIRELESDVLDVNEIFRDLAAMIHEQGEQIDTIEANVETAHTHVDEGREQLVKASSYQQKSRKKLCCLVVIFIIIAGVIALIVGLSVKK